MGTNINNYMVGDKNYFNYNHVNSFNFMSKIPITVKLFNIIFSANFNFFFQFVLSIVSFENLCCLLTEIRFELTPIYYSHSGKKFYVMSKNKPNHTHLSIKLVFFGELLQALPREQEESKRARA